MRHAHKITGDPTTQRSYTVTHEPQPDWSLRRGMDWAVRRYGHGNDWTVADGDVSRHSSHARAHEVGQHWVVEGREA